MLAKTLQTRSGQADRCCALRILEHDWNASIDPEALVQVIRICWLTLQVLGIDTLQALGIDGFPWTGEQARLLGKPLRGLEAPCLEVVSFHGELRGVAQGTPPPVDFLPLARMLGNHIPNLGQLSIHDANVHGESIASLCQGLEKKDYWLKLQAMEIWACNMDDDAGSGNSCHEEKYLLKTGPFIQSCNQPGGRKMDRTPHQ